MVLASNNEFPSVLFAEQGSDPSTPSSGFWRAYFKSDGLYLIEDDGTVYGPFGAGVGVGLTPYSQEGEVSVGAGTIRLPFPFAATIVQVRAMVGTAPTGASMIVDVHKNGTTIFTTQGNRPTIAASGNDSGNETPDVTAISAGDYLTVDVDQVGSSVAGSDLSVVVEWTK